MSLEILRKRVLANNERQRVEVNQRALIDKILARYCTDFVVYRELLQNADDAKASRIEINFRTNAVEQPKECPNNSSEKYSAIEFKNNGFAFREEDWDRLKKIAEGNPDEQKIGAFGVGFYSVFSLCEEPFVSSGEECMAFSWENDQLFYRRGKMASDDKWTTTLMNTREFMEIPSFEQFGNFLVTSMAFTENILEISVSVDDISKLKLSKNVENSHKMDISKYTTGYLRNEMFHLKSVDLQHVKIEATIEATIDVITPKVNTISLRIAAGNLDVHVTKEFSAKMGRVIKKKPPSTTVIQMIFSEFNENEDNVNNSNIFKDLVPRNKQGKIFIGFPTSQTTGCSLHLAARVIPTVERESIDLSEITLAQYNGNMLSMAGVLSRILYEDEMKILSSDWNGSDDAKIRQAVHAFDQFTFHSSTPNKKVGELIEGTFWSKSLPVVSSHGVRHITETKLPNEDMEVFIERIPTIPKKVLADCKGFFNKAKKRKMITDITLEDILEKELENRTLNGTEMTALIRWWIKYVTTNEVPIIKKNKFRDLAKLGWENKTSSLAKFKYFLDNNLIPPDNDFPVDMLPYPISRNFTHDSLKKHFGYQKLPFLVWIEFMRKTKLQELESDGAFAEFFLGILKRAFPNTSDSDKRTLSRLLRNEKIIPTKNGLRVPDEAYFPTVTLFPDLSTVEFRSGRSIFGYYDLLGSLGVRSHVELGVLFKYLDDPEKDWDHMELVKYLTSIPDKLKSEELKRLQDAQIWLREEQDTEISEKRTRYKISELYIPTSELKGLRQPTIEWKKLWLFQSKEAKFLMNLGLRTHPPLHIILALAAPPGNSEFRRKAFDYFIKNKKIYMKEYKSSNIKTGFLPCVSHSISATPSDCFVNPECQVMGFNVLSPDYVSYAVDLGVSQDPPIPRLINKLSHLRLKDADEAKKVFEYLAKRQGGPEWKALGHFKFIPVKGQYVSPNSCFLNSEDESYKDFFTYVDFGPNANSFLELCGVKISPTAVDLAKLLVTSSAKFWTKIGHDVEKYTDVLATIAASLPIMRREPGLISKMQVSPILLGIKKLSPHGISYCLEKANEIFLNDDENIWKIFGVLTCPVGNNVLERLYEYLGCRRLKQCVDIQHTSLGGERTSEKSGELESLIKKRANFFYHNRPDHEVNQNASWIRQNLRVTEVQEIKKTYYLIPKGETRLGPTSCYLKPDFTLVIAGSQYNYIDLAHILSEVIYKKPKEHDVLTLFSCLTLPEETLGQMYQVGRVMKLAVDEQKMVVHETIGDMNNEAYQEMSTSAQMQRFVTERTTTVAQIYNPRSIDVASIDGNDYEPFESMSENSVEHVTYRSRVRTRTTESVSEIQHVIHARRPMPMTSENTTILTTDLKRALRSCKSNLKNDVNSQRIEGLKSYCDTVPRNSLKFVRSFAKMDVYAAVNITRAELKKKNLNRFVKLLKELCDVFGHELSLDAIHVFYDADGESDAFNHDQTLFFNLHYDDSPTNELSYDSMVYWFISFCHVLAHNFEKSHNSKHAFYFSSFARNYISSLYTKLQQLGLSR